MKLFAIALAASLLTAGAIAGPVDDAAAGRAALAHGDDAAAVRLFSDAIDAQTLPRGAQAQALVGRARAYLASDHADLAARDADAALTLEPGNLAAADVRERAHASMSYQGAKESAPTTAAANDLNAQVRARNDAIAARNASAAADYEARRAEYEGRKQADAQAYANAQAAYQAQQQQHEADMAAWRAKVAACRAGDRSQCAGGH